MLKSILPHTLSGRAEVGPKRARKTGPKRDLLPSQKRVGRCLDELLQRVSITYEVSLSMNTLVFPAFIQTNLLKLPALFGN